jgi:HEAT repeat protein
LEALGLFGKEAGNADAVVSRATNDPDPLVRSAAIIALDKIEGRTNKVSAGK